MSISHHAHQANPPLSIMADIMPIGHYNYQQSYIMPLYHHCLSDIICICHHANQPTSLLAILPICHYAKLPSCQSQSAIMLRYHPFQNCSLFVVQKKPYCLICPLPLWLRVSKETQVILKSSDLIFNREFSLIMLIQFRKISLLKQDKLDTSDLRLVWFQNDKSKSFR